MVGVYLLSDELWVMGGLHLEGAVIGPQVDRIRDARATAFVHLQDSKHGRNGFVGFGARDQPFRQTQAQLC